MERVDLAVARAGAIGRKHVPTPAQSRRARRVANLDPAAAAAAVALAAEPGVAHLTGLAGLAGEVGVGRVNLAIPISRHPDPALACIVQVLRGLMEKPVLARATEGAALAVAAKAAGVPVRAGHHRRHGRRFASGVPGAVVVPDAALAPWRREPAARANPDHPPGGRNCLLSSRSEDALELPSPCIRLHGPGQRSCCTSLLPARIPLTGADPLIGRIDAFAAVIRRDAPPSVICADATPSVVMIDAIRRATAPRRSNTVTQRIAA